MSGIKLSGLSSVIRTVAVMLLLAGAAQAQWGDFSIDSLSMAPGGEQTGVHSLAIDTAGFAHVVWRLQTSGGSWILYTTNAPDGQWQTPDTVNQGNQAFTPSIDINPLTNAPIVAYAESGTLLLATPITDGWTAESIASAPSFLASAVLTVDDSAGIPHLAWIGSPPGSEEYKIFYRAVYWSSDIQILEGSSLGPFGMGAEPDIAVEPDGRVHITYRGGDFGMYHIDHAWNAGFDSPAWSYETIFTPNANDFVSSVQFDDYGTLHLAASGNDGFGFPPHIYYLRKTSGSGWTEPEEVTVGYTASNPALVVDATSVPHIVSMQTTGNFYTGMLLYSRLHSTGWNTSILTGDDFVYPAFAIDQRGYGHAVFGSGANTGVENIFHITSETPVAETITIVVTPADLDFGTIAVNSAATLYVTVHNAGTTPVLLLAASTGSPAFFSTWEGPDTLAPGADIELPVTFAPLDPVEYTELLQIQIAASPPVGVALHGFGDALSASGPFVPLVFDLGAYPNPFNPETSLSFSLPAAGHVRLAVYNILGHREAILADEWMPSGSYRLNFSGAHLPSGLYIAKLESGSNIKTLKLMLLK